MLRILCPVDQSFTVVYLSSDIVRPQIQKRGVKVYTGLCRHYHRLDEAGDGQLNIAELEKSLIDFHIDVPQEV